MTLSLVDANTERDAGNDTALHTVFDALRSAEDEVLDAILRPQHPMHRGAILEAVEHTRRAFDLLVRHAEGMR